jgi:hypothetical protein
MTEERLVLGELLEKAGEGDFLRAVAEAVLQLLMETDVEGLIGAGRYERSGERTTWRNGHRDRTLDTRLWPRPASVAAGSQRHERSRKIVSGQAQRAALAETLGELPVTGDKVVCIGHDHAAWSGRICR